MMRGFVSIACRVGLVALAALALACLAWGYSTALSRNSPKRSLANDYFYTVKSEQQSALYVIHGFASAEIAGALETAKKQGTPILRIYQSRLNPDDLDRILAAHRFVNRWWFQSYARFGYVYFRAERIGLDESFEPVEAFDVQTPKYSVRTYNHWIVVNAMSMIADSPEGRYLNRTWLIRLHIWLAVPFLGICPLVFFVLRRPLLRIRRRRSGLCARCGYDLRGCVSDRCPECGRPIALRITT